MSRCPPPFLRLRPLALLEFPSCFLTSPALLLHIVESSPVLVFFFFLCETSWHTSRCLLFPQFILAQCPRNLLLQSQRAQFAQSPAAIPAEFVARFAPLSSPFPSPHLSLTCILCAFFFLLFPFSPFLYLTLLLSFFSSLPICRNAMKNRTQTAIVRLAFVSVSNASVSGQNVQTGCGYVCFLFISHAANPGSCILFFSAKFFFRHSGRQ